ncbi:MAG TPA: PAS domain S-box protein, partial [Alphaproteobacteria bacterium]|nr:PAS domain S-box protein [Alphaproteobacteria bacterium]
GRLLDWLSAIRLPSGSSVTVLTPDSRIWLRHPFSPALIGSVAASDPFAAVVRADPAHLSRLVEVEAGDRDAVVGWRSLEAFGLVLVAGLDKSQLETAPADGRLPLLIALVVTVGGFALVTLGGRTQADAAPRPADAPPAPVPRTAPAPARRVLAFAENMPVVVFQQRLMPDGTVTYDYVSPGLREVFGIEPERLRSDPDTLFEMVHREDRERVRSEYRRAWQAGAGLDAEFRIVTPSGDVKWVHNVAGAGRGDGEARIWDGIVLDVTAQKEAESKLRAIRDEAEITSRVKADFLANVSHELREPLNAIIGFAEVISQQAYGPVGVEKYVEYAHDINESADHLLAVVNDILDLSKIEAGRATLVLEDVEAGELVDSCLRLIHGRAADARLQLRRFVERSLPTLRVDPLKVKQILINLLSNAIKFTRPGGTVTLRVTAAADGGVAFSVVDTGIGIPEQELPRAIETYGQVATEGGTREGTGLGLPLAKALTELHGGSLKIESSAGKGTTVTAWFPP